MRNSITPIWLVLAVFLITLLFAHQCAAHWTRQTSPPDADQFWKSAIVITDADDGPSDASRLPDHSTTTTTTTAPPSSASSRIPTTIHSNDHNNKNNIPKNKERDELNGDDQDDLDDSIEFATDLASDSKSNPDEATRTTAAAGAGGAKKQQQPFQIENYYFEIGCLVLVTAFAINFMFGSARNRSLFNSILSTVHPQLTANFSIVGSPIRENAAFYRVICTGRRNCEGMCATFELQRRQDLFAYAWYILFPSHDFVSVDIPFGAGVTDPFIFCIFRKSRESAIRDFGQDISDFSLIAKPWTKLPKHFALFSENSPDIFDRIFDRFESLGLWDNLEYIHITDQGIYTPQSKNCMRIVMRLPQNSGQTQKFESIFRLILEMIDLVARIKLQSVTREKNMSKRNSLEEEKKKKVAEEKKKKEDEKKEAAEKKSAATLEKEEKKREKKEAKKRLPKVKIMYG